MEPEELMSAITEILRNNGIVDVGVADASAWMEDPLVSSRVPV